LRLLLQLVHKWSSTKSAAHLVAAVASKSLEKLVAAAFLLMSSAAVAELTAAIKVETKSTGSHLRFESLQKVLLLLPNLLPAIGLALGPINGSSKTASSPRGGVEAASSSS
jgi:hypothetical protein